MALEEPAVSLVLAGCGSLMKDVSEEVMMECDHWLRLKHRSYSQIFAAMMVLLPSRLHSGLSSTCLFNEGSELLISCQFGAFIW